MRSVYAGTHQVSVTPTVATSAYADDDRLGSIETVASGGDGHEPVTLLDIVIIDQAAQSSAMKILFFNDEPTIASADNAALDIADTEITKFVGHADIAATDYCDCSSSSAGTVRSIGLGGMKGISTAPNGQLWMVVQSKGTPTYAATDDLTFKFNFAKDAEG